MRNKKNQKIIKQNETYPGVRELRKRNRSRSNYYKNDPSPDLQQMQTKRALHRSNKLREWFNGAFDNIMDEAIDFFNKGEYAENKQ